MCFQAKEESTENVILKKQRAQGSLPKNKNEQLSISLLMTKHSQMKTIFVIKNWLVELAP